MVLKKIVALLLSVGIIGTAVTLGAQPKRKRPLSKRNDESPPSSPKRVRYDFEFARRAAQEGNWPDLQAFLSQVGQRISNEELARLYNRAVLGGHLFIMQQLEQRGVDPLARQANGYTSLHYALASRSIPMLNWLWERGVRMEPFSAELTGRGLSSWIDMAMRVGDPAVMRWVLNRGADVSQLSPEFAQRLDESGQQALAEYRRYKDDPGAFVVFLAGQRDLDALRYIIEQNRERLTQQDFERALDRAYQVGDIEALQTLINLAAPIVDTDIPAGGETYQAYLARRRVGTQRQREQERRRQSMYRRLFERAVTEDNDEAIRALMLHVRPMRALGFIIRRLGTHPNQAVMWIPVIIRLLRSPEINQQQRAMLKLQLDSMLLLLVIKGKPELAEQLVRQGFVSRGSLINRLIEQADAEQMRAILPGILAELNREDYSRYLINVAAREDIAPERIDGIISVLGMLLERLGDGGGRPQDVMVATEEGQQLPLIEYLERFILPRDRENAPQRRMIIDLLRAYQPPERRQLSLAELMADEELSSEDEMDMSIDVPDLMPTRADLEASLRRIGGSGGMFTFQK